MVENILQICLKSAQQPEAALQLERPDLVATASADREDTETSNPLIETVQNLPFETTAEHFHETLIQKLGNFCGIVSCDLYWGCPAGDDSCKLYSLQNIDDVVPLLNNIGHLDALDEGYLNIAEIDYLDEYISLKGMTWTGVWKESLDMLDSKAYVCSTATALSSAARTTYFYQNDHSGTPRDPLEAQSAGEREERSSEVETSDTESIPSEHLNACYACAVNIVNGQLFGYWKSVQSEQLPDHIKNRENCWWGTACRTQWHKLTPLSAEARRRGYYQ
ncbi:hypothetical protein DFQ28_000725 [Apophysomyces sp. BC1034]|nr:hypothetical protein DFQ29_010109 [Apophysomyces sp. BC1021]KAG0191232.1 hypothetical protein DFQ28_000725 [Apophysomyces sp. BC1034]